MCPRNRWRLVHKTHWLTVLDLSATACKATLCPDFSLVHPPDASPYRLFRQACWEAPRRVLPKR